MFVHPEQQPSLSVLGLSFVHVEMLLVRSMTKMKCFLMCFFRIKKNVLLVAFHESRDGDEIMR